MISRNDESLKKKATETNDDYCHRIASLKDSIENATWTTIANIINHNLNTDYSADRYRKAEKKRHGVTEDEYIPVAKAKDDTNCVTEFDKESISMNYSNGEVTSSREIPLSHKQLTNPDELLKAHGYDPKEWDIKRANNAKTTRTTPNGEFNYYASRITIAPKKSMVTDVEEVAKYLEHFKPCRQTSNNEYKPSDETLVIPLYDLHFGRLPDQENFEKYDINEEKEKIVNHVKKYLDKFEDRDFNEIYLIVGQDFLNSSFTGFTSSQSHLQSNAIDFKTMFKAGSELLITIIDMFSNKCNRLKVIGSLGNHDISEEVMLFMLLKAYYRWDVNIEVDDGFAPRKYYEIGNSCVGFGHLDKEGKRSYGLMQVEAKEIWGRTKCHVFIAGHLHHFSVGNENGVELYRVPAICAPDNWTVTNGYVTNEPKTMCFIFDENEGLTETHFMYL